MRVAAFFGRRNLSEKEWKDECEPGPVRVSLDLDRGRVVALRAYVGGTWRGTPVLDLGTVSPADATDFLLGIAERGEGKPAKDAIFPASITEGAIVWPRLLTLAKDTDRPRDVRESAVFWVSQAEGRVGTGAAADRAHPQGSGAAADRDLLARAVEGCAGDQLLRGSTSEKQVRGGGWEA